jgi:hypothetical protein
MARRLKTPVASLTLARLVTFSGELVCIDPINRRGGLRLDGDEGRYFTGPPHWFALLPRPASGSTERVVNCAICRWELMCTAGLSCRLPVNKDDSAAAGR